MKFIIQFLLLTVSTPLFSYILPSEICDEPTQYYCTNPYKIPAFQFYIAPEVYHVHRKRTGGAKQDGYNYGVRLGYDKIQRSKLYYGFDALYAKGPLKGKGISGDTVKSNFTDISVEGRFGYALGIRSSFNPLLTPFIGIGKFEERNHFTHPKATPIHFNTSYFYGTAGFLSRVQLTTRFYLGLNFKVKYPYEARCRVSNDPQNNNSKQNITEKIQYRAELPLTYQLSTKSDHIFLSFVPFYEFRKYGYQPNFPCDFLETTLNIFGIQLKIMYCL